MIHEPASSNYEDNAVEYKTRLGITMFVIYAVIYAGFVIINVFSPILMEAEILFGLNLAVIYGFGLIVFALILALIYNYFCTKQEKLVNKEETKESNKT